MKLKKEDYMRLPKERLAELLAEMDDVKVDPIVIPAPPVTTPNDPWKPYPYPYGPIITYTDTKPNTNDTTGNPELHAYQEKK